MTHGGRLNIQRLVILDDAHRLAPIDRACGHFDWLEEKRQAKRVQETVGLREVLALAVEAEREGFQTGGTKTQAEHGVIGNEENRTAVDARREANADRPVRRVSQEPLGDLIAQRLDVLL